MQRNIFLAYLITICRWTWLWAAIWVLFYLRFTTYAGIGILETINVVFGTFGDVPGGICADIFGKKMTLILGLFSLRIGTILMGVAQNFLWLCLTVVLISSGYAFCAGTLESLLYSSLQKKKQLKKYHQVISTLNSLKWLMIAVGAICGGFLYTISPGLPFLVTGSINLVGVVFALFLQDGHQKKENYSLMQFVNFTHEGFQQLFRNKNARKKTYVLLTIGIFCVVGFQVINDILPVEYGFKAEQLGILMAITYLVSAVVSQFSSYLTRFFSPLKFAVGTGLILGVCWMLSPVIHYYVGAAVLIVIVGCISMLENVNTVVISHQVEDKYRTTALSAFSMVRNMPYFFSAFLIGKLMDAVTARHFAFMMGAVLCVCLLVELRIWRFDRMKA